MNDRSLLTPLFKTIDKWFFGIDEVKEIQKAEELLVSSENEEEFDVVRSIN